MNQNEFCKRGHLWALTQIINAAGYAECRLCRRERQRQVKRNIEKTREYYRRYHQSERGKAADRRYKDAHRNDLLVRSRTYEQSDRAKVIRSAYRKSIARKFSLKKYQQSEKGKVLRKKIDQRLRERFPAKRKARDALNNALKAGKITRQPCSQCGNPVAEGHHDDYSKAVEVIWLCFQCHRNTHYKKGESDAIKID